MLALAGASAVFTAAPFEVLPDAEIRLAKAAKAQGVRRIVKLSAQEFETADPYSSAHRVAEQAIAASGLEWTFLRPNVFMQNYTTVWANTIRMQGAFYEAAANGKSGFIDVRDIAAVAAKALTETGHQGQAYTLTGATALDRYEAAAFMSAAAGKPIKYVAIDEAGLRQAMSGAPAKLLELLAVLYTHIRAGESAVVTSTVQEILGRNPITFAEFARDNAAAWR